MFHFFMSLALVLAMDAFALDKKPSNSPFRDLCMQQCKQKCQADQRNADCMRLCARGCNQ